MVGRNGFSQLTVVEMRAREVGVCSPVGTLGVAATATLWQSAPQRHFGDGVVAHNQPLAPFPTDEVYNPSLLFNLLTLPWAAPALRLAG